jgi:hypothetical protein
MRWRILLGLALVAVLGCGGNRFVPISGTVTLDGKPLPNATVSFQPIAPEGSIDAGIGSTGKTDAQGHYSLIAANGQTGALVGKHRVQISAVAAEVGDSDERPPRGGWTQKDKVPEKYDKNPIEKDVPAGGTDKMDFDLDSH